MNRRDFLKSLTAAAAAIGLRIPVHAVENVEAADMFELVAGTGITAYVWIGGYEVSNECHLALVPKAQNVERTGWVEVYQYSPKGYILVDTPTAQPIWERKHGLVKWRER